jgi:GAF domain-containing protein
MESVIDSLAWNATPEMSDEHIGNLRKWASELVHRGEQGDLVGLVRVVDLISKNFAVQPHEVAILALASDERFLKFLMPENLRAVGRIPLSSTISLAARTARDGRAEIINHFSMVPHASVFEAVPIVEQQRGEAIQKIMSAPIVLDGEVIGVLQISRKGTTAADAGPDFTHPQLRELKIIADALAPCIPPCAKE